MQRSTSNILKSFFKRRSATHDTKTSKPNLRLTVKNLKSRKKTDNKKKIEKFYKAHNIQYKPTMENSNRILSIIRNYKSNSKSLLKCPEEITKEMLVIEHDCEDLRANKEKETRDRLWSAYREVNSHLFNDRSPPTNEDVRKLRESLEKIKGKAFKGLYQ
jgi:hypothetical protein